MKKNLFFIALALIVLLGVVSPVSADSGNNTCPDSAMDGHFCAQSPGKVIEDPETGEIIPGILAKEWSMPSCSYLHAYKKASENNKDGWNLLFTENCDVKPTPAPTQPTQPTTEPTQKPSAETDESEPASATTVGGCPDPECICIEIGPDTQSFITTLANKYFDLKERSADRFFELVEKFFNRFFEIWEKK